MYSRLGGARGLARLFKDSCRRAIDVQEEPSSATRSFGFWSSWTSANRKLLNEVKPRKRSVQRFVYGLQWKDDFRYDSAYKVRG